MRITTLNRCLLAALATASILGLAAPAFAQATDVPVAKDNGGVIDIVVTARRRNESIQTTPLAITAITTSGLEAKATTNIGDLQGAAPNLLITQQNSGAQAANLSIRGLTYADIEKSQDPTVAVVIDGVFIGTNTGQLLDFFDISSIEVLRGPQGVLFGRNTIGGVINITRTAPKDTFSAKVEADYGLYNTWSGKAVVTGPLVKGLLDVKAFYMHGESDGFYTNDVTAKLAGGYRNDNYGLAFKLTPSPNFDATLTLEQQKQYFDVVNSNIARTGELFCAFEPAGQCNRNTSTSLYHVFTSPGSSYYRAPAATLQMNYNAGGIKLTSITGYREGHENQTQDFDSSPTDLYYVHRIQNYWQFSEELRASGNIVKSLDFVLGGYYFRSGYDFIQYTRLFAFNPTLSPDIADTNPQISNPKSESVAGFADFDWKFADKFRLSFGGRFTHDKKSLYNAFKTGGVINDGTPISFDKFTPKASIDYRPDNNTLLYASWSRGYRSGGFSPRASTPAQAKVPYQPENVDSYEIGAKLTLFDRKLIFNIDGFIEKYKNMQQNTTIPGGPTGNQTITGNVAAADIKGIEADFTARPIPELKFNGSIGILDAKFKNFIAGNSIGNVLPTFVGTTPAGAAAVLALPNTSPGVADPRVGLYTSTATNLDYSANHLIYAPNVTASLNAEYTLHVDNDDVKFNLGYRYIAPYDQQISLGPITGTLPNATITGPTTITVTQPTAPLVVNGNDARVRTEAQSLLDASVSLIFHLNNSKARATIYGRNLLNHQGTTAAFTVAGLWSFASAQEPRVYGVQLGLEF
jgi:iron complex outermembrane receptor protein